MNAEIGAMIKPEPRSEWINGVEYFSPPANPNHGITRKYFERQLDFYFEDKPCRVFSDGTALTLKKYEEVITAKDLKEYVIPDIYVFCEHPYRFIKNNIVGIPDFIVEVLSPGSVHLDLFEKREIYFTAGVKEYWVVDYLEKINYIFKKDSVEPRRYKFKGKVPISIFPNLEIDFDLIEGKLLWAEE